MKTLAFIWLLVSAIVIKGQGTVEFNNTGAPDIPFAETNSTASIATFIKANFKTDPERLFAIYSWVTTNIKYDTDSMYVFNSGIDPATKVTAALRRRKAVCENYAAVFTDITLKCNIPCYEVSGYTKQYGTIDKTSHMWCAVYLQGKWYFCDPTWDTGLNNNVKYFLVNPSLFIESHMPFDPLWQLLDHMVSHKEFYTGNTYSKKDKPFISFVDSLTKYNKMDSLEKLEAIEARITQAGIANEHIRTNLVYVQMQISMINQGKNEMNYNAAVNDFNNANAMLNGFIQYRNKQFVPIKPDKEIGQLLDPINNIISLAYKKLDEVDHSADNFQYNTEALRNLLNKLSGRLQDQNGFLKRYFLTPISDRNRLFLH